MIIQHRDLKSTKSPTNKSSKGAKVSKKTKSPSHAKGSKLSSKAPTVKCSKKSKKSRLVSIDSINFEDLVVGFPPPTPYEGLIWNNWEVVSYGGTLVAIPTATTASIEISCGVFSLTSAFIGDLNSKDVTINGYDSSGKRLLQKTITSANASLQKFDLPDFALIAKLEFVFDAVRVSAVDNLVFL
jgi:hypothetical protein